MSVHKVATPYAKALMDLAVERNVLEQVKGDMDAFSEATKNRDLYLLLKSPIIKADKKESILNILFSEHFHEMTMSFLRIIVSKSREAYLPEIGSSFLELYERKKGISRIRIISAKPLAEAEFAAIKDALLKSDVTDESLMVTTEIDESLIGGFVLEFDHRRYDASVASRLKELRKEFKGNPYVSKIIAS